ncbi:glycosyltransferase family 39 protein [Jatrophihabitans endophyticus]|uniref:glycosyltransferase family 39 protein n=1 Tax=Jatrophihabitans endophyticus TaxID=1206085 RepID=UPI001A029031|nr:glycosyltransferase family 39 protein [Jatrophihabitans endophyticus]MBE7187229.1 glycosyltransferase family 39 protein [Jatrophihabitans endophyticus]
MLDTRAPDTDDAAPARPGHRVWLDRLAPLLPALFMLVLGIWGLGRDDAMGNDEVATRWIASLSLPAMRHVLSHLDAVHGLYYGLIHFWLHVGRSPTAIRVPSLLAAVLAVVVVARLGRRITGSTRAGMTAGLVAAGTSSVSFYAQTARSYTMVYLVVALATLVLVRCLDPEPGTSAFAVTRLWATYGLLVVVGGYLNELSLLVLGAHLVTVLCARRGWGALVRWLASAVVAVLLVLPLIRLSQQQSTVLDYLTPPDGADVWTLFHLMFGGTAVVAVLVAAVAAVGAVTRVPTAAPVNAASVGLPLLVVPAALLMLYSEVETPLYADRYVLFGEIGAALLAGAGLERLLTLVPAPRRVAAAVVLVACAAVFLGQLGTQQEIRTPASRQFDFGGPAQFVGQHARPGDGVLFFGLFYRKARLGYPEDFRDTTDFAMEATPAAVASFRGRNLPFGAVRQLMLGYRRIWVVGRPAASVGGTTPAVQLQAAVLERHFTRVEHATFGKVTATLWRRI